MSNANLNVIATALAKRLKPDALPSGEYNLDGLKVLVSFSGKMVKGEAEERTPTTNIPHIAVLALFAQKTGIMQEHCFRLLEEAMTEAVTLGKKGEETIKPFVKDYEKAEEKVRATLAALPKVKVEGKVLTKGVNIQMEVVQ